MTAHPGQEGEAMAERTLHGLGAAPGVAIGRVVRYTSTGATRDREPIVPDAVDAEIARLRAAAERARARIAAAREAAAMRAGEAEAAIFDAHLLMLDDPALIGESERRIREEHLPAAVAVEETAAGLRHLFGQIEDAYLRERAADVTDVATQVVRALQGDTLSYVGESLPPDAVIVAEELFASDAALLSAEHVAALVTARGGRTAHVAILARALGLPVVVGVVDILSLTRDGEVVAVDGERGEVVLSPGSRTLAALEERIAAERLERERRAELRDLPAVTEDGARVALFANIGAPGEIEAALSQGAEGIGLFRTEFLFLERSDLPGEAEQFLAYQEVAREMGGRPVVVRTLDVGGDKPVPGIPVATEMNPFLGVRGLRLTLRHPEIFRTQLRAILRAATAGDIWVMFPMVTTVEDVRAARATLASVLDELRVQGIEHRADIPVGIMIEVPAAAMVADRLIKEVDFFSLGTNDLAQYALAVDRTNESLTAAYPPFDVAVLRLIERAVAAATAAGKPVAVCGELAGDPEAIPLLVGLGLRELSMTATSIPRAKEIIRRLRAREEAIAARTRLT
jgi:phosphotransferase system enzyme I (PtsI)